MKLIKSTELDDSFFAYQEGAEIDSVREIIENVKNNGDEAVKRYTKEFDGVDVDKLRLVPEAIETAYYELDPSVRETLKAAADKIKRFARKQKEQLHDFEYEIQTGVFTGQRIVPIERVGVYTPGGSYPLPSTVLMGAIPAKVAGCREVIICSPPTYEGDIHPAILGAAYVSEVNEIYRIGGVQAIAAMAWGTESMKPVDLIVGPGNQYVTAAKRIVFGRVGIDFLAGPTEVLIVADDSANPAYIAADLLAQAEHDAMAIPILVTPSETLADAVNEELKKQLQELATAEIADTAVKKNGLIILSETLEEAFIIANRRAPEHLELMVEHADVQAEHLKNYGSLFIGNYAAEVLGDYSAGVNHTLPTNTCARYTGGLSVFNFLKVQTTLRTTKDGLNAIGPVAKHLGEIEGLDGHARSAAIRLDDTGRS